MSEGRRWWCAGCCSATTSPVRGKGVDQGLRTSQEAGSVRSRGNIYTHTRPCLWLAAAPNHTHHCANSGLGRATHRHAHTHTHIHHTHTHTHRHTHAPAAVRCSPGPETSWMSLNCSLSSLAVCWGSVAVTSTKRMEGGAASRRGSTWPLKAALSPACVCDYVCACTHVCVCVCVCVRVCVHMGV